MPGLQNNGGCFFPSYHAQKQNLAESETKDFDSVPTRASREGEQNKLRKTWCLLLLPNPSTWTSRYWARIPPSSLPKELNPKYPRAESRRFLPLLIFCSSISGGEFPHITQLLPWHHLHWVIHGMSHQPGAKGSPAFMDWLLIWEFLFSDFPPSFLSFFLFFFFFFFFFYFFFFSDGLRCFWGKMPEWWSVACFWEKEFLLVERPTVEWKAKCVPLIVHLNWLAGSGERMCGPAVGSVASGTSQIWADKMSLGHWIL